MGPRSLLRALRRAFTNYPKMRRELPVDEQLVLLDAQCGRSICGNLFYIARELAENPDYAGLDLWISTGRSTRREAAALLAGAGLAGRVKPVLLNSRRYFRLLASAQWLVTDTCFVPEWKKRAGQVVWNTWHGTPLKCMGLDIREGFQDVDNPRKNLMAADFLSYPCFHAADVMLGAYMPRERAGRGEPSVDPTLLFADYPRNAALLDEAGREGLRARIGLADSRVIASLPTYRPPAPDGQPGADFQRVLGELDACLGAGELVLARLHPIAAGQVDFGAFARVRPFPDGIELYETLGACDALLTDYSSVLFDYAETGRPIVLLAFDEAAYFATRGAYLRLDELPFPKVETATAAIAALGGAQPDRTAFLERFCPHKSTRAAADLCARVFAGVRSPRVVEGRMADVPETCREGLGA